MAGWIKLHRAVFESGAFKREPMSEREAFIWMISAAAFEDTTHRVGSEVIPVPRGSMLVTLRELQAKFMWRSDTRVRNFLAGLDRAGMIALEIRCTGRAKKTHVTICNYGEYQDAERTRNAQETHKKRSKEEGKNKECSSYEEQDRASEAFDLFKAMAERIRCPNPAKLTPARKRAILARLKECGGIDGWHVALRKVEASEFLRRGSWFGIDWMCKPQNFTKIMEGNYDNRDRQSNGANHTGRGSAHDSLLAGFGAFARGDGDGSGFDPDGGEATSHASDAGLDRWQDGYASQPVLRVIGS